MPSYIDRVTSLVFAHLGLIDYAQAWDEQREGLGLTDGDRVELTSGRAAPIRRGRTSGSMNNSRVRNGVYSLSRCFGASSRTHCSNSASGMIEPSTFDPDCRN